MAREDGGNLMPWMILMAQSTTAGDLRSERSRLKSAFFTLPSGSTTKWMTMVPCKSGRSFLALSKHSRTGFLFS